MTRLASGIRLAGWETLEEDHLEMCSPSTQPARPARSWSLLVLSAPSLTKPKFTYSRLASLRKLKGPRAFKTLKLAEIKGSLFEGKQLRELRLEGVKFKV